MPLRRFFLVGLLVLIPAALVGCQKDEPITSYTVEQPGREKLRLLAAIVPHGDKIWFFRLSGPEEAVSKQKANFDQLLDSVRIDEKQDPPLQWEAPKGWKERPGQGMRVAAFRIEDEPSLELTVIALGKEAASVLENVNRWRDQLTLPPLEQDELDRAVIRRKVADEPMTVVDLSGVGKHTPPGHGAMAGGPAPHHGERKQAPFSFKAPESWKKQPKPAPMSVESYEVADGKESALVTVTVLPGEAGGFVENVNRWRGQVGLKTVAGEQILQESQPIKMADRPARLVDLDNPQGPEGKNRILGAILPMEGFTFFVKMTGPSELVGRHRENFESFVTSFELHVDIR